MKKLNLYTILASAVLLSACSTNQDLANLGEYDDIYYTGQPAIASVSTSATGDNGLEGATDAERSYYDNVPYTETDGSAKQSADSDVTDYYDEDYASRIDNFHRSNNGDYIYSNSPSLSMNMGYGFSSFGSGFGFGMSYGYPYYPRSPYFSYGMPYYGMGYNYGFGYPYYYNPYVYYPRPYYDPFYPSYGYGGYYGGGYYGGVYPPYYGGGDYYGSTGIKSTPRQESSSVRPSRGGVITQGTSDGRKSIGDNPKNVVDSKARSQESRRPENIGRTQDVDLRKSEVRKSEQVTREDVNREAREYTRPGTTRSDYTRSEPSRTTQPVRQQTRQPVSPRVTPDRSNSRNVVAPAQRTRSAAPSNQRERSTVAPRSAPTYNRGATRSRSNSYSAPDRSASPSRSVSPSRNTGSGGSYSSPSSSPSRGNRR